MYFQESEIVNLIVSVVAIYLIFILLKKVSLQEFKLFIAGFCAIVVAQIFTVLEGIFWGDLLNTLEHLFYVVSGLLFVLACWQRKKSEGEQE